MQDLNTFIVPADAYSDKIVEN